jgi:hypothetical protein
LASKFPARRDQLLFLINNYDVVMSIIVERTKDDSKESETFREQLKGRSEEFAEQMLEQHFGPMISWVKEAERKLDKGDVEGLRQVLSFLLASYFSSFSSSFSSSSSSFSSSAFASSYIQFLHQEERRVTLIIQNFSADWKKSLDSINGEIMTSFPNLKLGTGILQQSLTQLVQYYHRFSRVLGVAPLAQIPAAAQLINIHQLMVEVKRYKPSF